MLGPFCRQLPAMRNGLDRVCRPAGASVGAATMTAPSALRRIVPPLSSAGHRGDALQFSTDRLFVLRPHQARHLTPIAQEQHRGPQLDSEGPAQRSTAAIFNLQMTHLWMPVERAGDVGLSRAAPAAPRRATTSTAASSASTSSRVGSSRVYRASKAIVQRGVVAPTSPPSRSRRRRGSGHFECGRRPGRCVLDRPAWLIGRCLLGSSSCVRVM